MLTINILKATSELEAIQQHIPKGDIEEKYVEIYHRALAAIQQETGLGIQEFLISEVELTKRNNGTTRNSEGNIIQRYTEKRYCDQEFFLIKINAALNFFRYLTQDDIKQKIGF